MSKTVPSPQQMADNWMAGIQGAGKKYTDAINRVNVSPGAAAATPAAMAAYLAGVQNSVTSGKRARSLNFDLSFWKNQTTQFGGPNYAASGQKGRSKYQNGVSRMGSAYQDASNAASAITGPKGKARALARVGAVIDVLQAAAARM